MDHDRSNGNMKNSAAVKGSINDDNENASSDMNEVDFDKNDLDFLLDSPERQKVRKKKISKPNAKLLVDKKKLQQYVEDGEVLVPVPRARRRFKGNELGYMVKREDIVVKYIDKDGIVYNPNDTAYLQNREKGKPYFVCAIQRFNLTKRDTLMVGIKWFFRLSEVPGSVYHHLTLDRELHRKNGEDFIHDTSIQQRELFSSEATDTLPVTSLRGKCHVVQYTDLKSACSFVPSPDHFFYILAYRPDNRRLATTQGEIRVGPSHQARLPECKPGTSPADMPEKCEQREEIRWRPYRVVDGDLLMYLRAARSIAAFAGMCGGTTEDRCEAEAMDETTVNALDTLHLHNYDTSKSLQALVRGPSVMYKEKKWNEEDIKRFAKGLRHLGKNFFKIRKEHLPHKDTSELVEFYYFWKKSPAANNSRPTYRRHRRQLKRQSPRNNQPDNEVSSGSESGEESEESDGGRDVTSICQRCLTTDSKDWHSGKDGEVLCIKCHLSYKKYGEESGVESPPPCASPDQYLFKPVPEDEETTPSKHNMRTRRSNNTSSTNGKKKERISVSSPDPDSAPATTSSGSTTSTVTTSSCSKSSRKSPNNLPDKDSKKLSQKSKESNKAKKRRIVPEEESKFVKKKKDSSDSESSTESSSVSGTEDIGNEADSDDNNQEELSSSSSPSSVERGFKPLQPQPPTPGTQQVIPSPGTPVSSPQEVAVNVSTVTDTGSVTSSVSAHKVNSDPPVPTLLPSQYLNIPSALPALTTTGVQPTSTPSLSSTLLPSSGGGQHLRLPQRSSPLQVYKTSFSSTGHISSAKTGSSPSSALTPASSLTSPLVIPTLSRASSTGIFIPQTEPPVSASTVGNVPANINTAVTTKTSLAPTSVDPVIAPAALTGRVASGPSISTTNSSSSTIINSASSTPVNRMQEQPEEQEKKPVVPPPGSFITPSGTAPYAPYHSFYYPPSGAAHLSHFHPSVAMSVTSSSGGTGHQAPPPCPILIPIKKEPHSPPPPLKPSEKVTDLSSASAPGSSSHMLHRPHSENPVRHPHGFPPSGISSTVPIPPPPLTVIDHRDSSKSSDQSKPDPYNKDGSWGHSSSPHHPESHPASGAHRDRMDSNFSVLRESREIGLAGGLNPSQVGQQLPLTSIKEEPRLISAAFQPYSHHHPPPTASSASSHSSSSVLQIPQPGLPPESHSAPSLLPSQSVLPDSYVSSRSAPSLVAEGVIKKEQPSVDEIELDEEDEDSRGGSTTPGPTPTVCNREIYKSNSALFVKIFDRGDRNQCSRTDFIFRPLPESNLAKKREERVRKSSQPSSAIKEEKKRVETPPRATSASEGQKSSSSGSSSSSSHPTHSIGIGGGYPERHTPRPFADMPALRQLHEYARPHVYAASLDDVSLLRFTGQDPTRPPYSLGGLPHHPPMDPLMSYRLGLFQPGSRERLEMELERDKRERDAREREMRERELRDLELREKMKQDMELKPGLDRLLPPGAASQLTDPNWLDLQRRMGFPPTAAGHLLPHGAASVSAAGAHLPGVYQPVNLASDLLAREREKLDRLGRYLYVQFVMPEN